MNKPLVTIITPAYNCERYISLTTESVMKQSYENIKYFVIDDASKDTTPDMLGKIEELMKNLNAQDGVDVYDELEVIYNKVNLGEQRTVNKALDWVKGKYFMIVNADDPLLPGAVSKLVEFMEAHPDILCAYPDWESINEDGSHRAYIKSREYDFKYMINHHTCLPSVGSMFRSSLLKTIRRDESYRWLGDFDFWLKVGFAGPMARVPETLATWRHRDGQASGDKSDRRAQEHIRIIKELFLSSSMSEDMKINMYHQARCWSYIVAAAVTDSKAKAFGYLAKAWIYFPEIFFVLHFWDAVRKRALHYLRR